ncbi:MarR family transcriptional regulator [Fictibacillus iocasae]|uniref:MarR family transcriptional regulator n=1 Tax=Fictibacillus iocasae TaxID=2715437 RepID=A0ABW2NQM6_9BACL
MGTWGTDLWEDDFSCDIQEDWNHFIDEGMTPEKATAVILEEWLVELDDYDDDEERQPYEALLYIAVAALQLENEALQSKVKNKALQLIDAGGDLSLWEDGDSTDYEKRKQVLARFKRQLEDAKAN